MYDILGLKCHKILQSLLHITAYSILSLHQPVTKGNGNNPLYNHTHRLFPVFTSVATFYETKHPNWFIYTFVRQIIF